MHEIEHQLRGGLRGRRPLWQDGALGSRGAPGFLLEAPVAQENVEPRVELAPRVETLQMPEGVEKGALGGGG